MVDGDDNVIDEPAAAAMIDYATGKTKGVVIGGGLLGLEAARGLQSRGLTVDVVHATSTLMNAQLDDAAGAILRRSVELLGADAGSIVEMAG